MERFICLDTETTGLSVISGSRIIEIGMVELVNHEPKRRYQSYFSSNEKLSEIVKNITKITDEMLQNQPDFKDKANEIMEFINKDENGDNNKATLVIHNAKFDLSFLNFQLNEAICTNLSDFKVIDTMDIIRRHSPGAKLTLDSLCEKYNISLADREEMGHGALLDSELLAKVFIALINDGADINFQEKAKEEIVIVKRKDALEKRQFSVSTSEQLLHDQLLQSINAEQW